jgi:hypothetical protein
MTSPDNVTVRVSPDAERHLAPNDITHVVRELCRRAERRPGWTSGSLHRVTFAKDGRQFYATLAHRGDHYAAYFAPTTTANAAGTTGTASTQNGKPAARWRPVRRKVKVRKGRMEANLSKE